MARNKLSDLNDHLFAQIERLGDEDLTPEQVKMEIGRAKAISSVASQVINNARVVLDATKMVNNGQTIRTDLPKYIDVNNSEK